MSDEIGKLHDSQNNQFKSFQIPANLMVAEFGEVNVRRNLATSNSQITECHVEFTIAMEPQGQFAEGWRTGLALDASASMKRVYGRKVEARVDPELLAGYIKQGRLQAYIEDGEPTRKIQREAFVEIQEKGYAINYTENILQPLVQDFTAYLADNLDRTGKTSLIYWGCGKGEEIQVLGEFDAITCQQIKISGPATFQLGKTTKLCPAIAYFADQYRQAQRGIYIFLTDGRIDDLEQVKDYTRELALEIAVGKRNYLKLVLVGIGNDIDRYQLQELDDFDTGLDLDLWDYKIASEMTNLSQIFAELVNENQIIAENASIYDDHGDCVKSYPQGLPAKVDFVMPNDSKWFELEVGGQRIRQSVVVDSVVDSAIAPLTPKKLFDFELKAQESSQPSNLINPNPNPNPNPNQETNQEIAQESKNSQIPIQTYRWKWIAALLIGMAFIGTAIAFGILMKRSDDRNRQEQAISIVKEETEPNSKSTSVNKSNNNSLASIPKLNSDKLNSDKSNSTNSNNASSNSLNNTSSKSIDKLTSKPSSNISEKTTKNSLIKNSANAFVLNNSLPNSQKESSNLTICKSFGICFTDSNKANTQKSDLQNNLINNLDNSTNNSNGNFNVGKKTDKLTANSSSQTSSVNNSNTSTTSLTPPLNPSTQTKNSDRNTSASIVPISNSDIEAIIFFPSDDSQLMPTEVTKIDKFLTKIQGRRGVIQVSGHADVMGDYTYNLDLSQARANEVVKQLRDRGIDNNYRITFEALSSSHPLRKNATTTDNAFNRRVVIQFQEQK
ncbi:MAG: OmpA family protein [Pseudanabaena sp. ELA645]|jgi:outer membrane protein OmpA-like peptidoglycan-associated protein